MTAVSLITDVGPKTKPGFEQTDVVTLPGLKRPKSAEFWYSCSLIKSFLISKPLCNKHTDLDLLD